MEDLGLILSVLSIVSAIASASVFLVIKLFLKPGRSLKINGYADLLKAADRAQDAGAGLPSMLLAYSSLEALLTDRLATKGSMLNINEKLRQAEAAGLLDVATAEDVRRLTNIRNSVVHGYRQSDLDKVYSKEKVSNYLSEVHRVVKAIESSDLVVKKIY